MVAKQLTIFDSFKKLHKKSHEEVKGGSYLEQEQPLPEAADRGRPSTLSRPETYDVQCILELAV